MSEGQKYHCGPKSWPKFMRKRLSRYHNASCKLHDKDYITRTKSRKEIDQDFLCRMLKRAEDGETSKLRRKMKRHAKWLHFWVRKFAWVFWLKKKGGQLDVRTND